MGDTVNNRAKANSTAGIGSKMRMGSSTGKKFSGPLESTGSYLETGKVVTGAAQDPTWNLHDRRMVRHTLK